MSPNLVILKRKFWLSSWELTMNMRSLVESRGRAELNGNVWGTDTDVFDPGRKGSGMAAQAFWEAGRDKIEEVLWTQFEERNVPITLALTDGTANTPARLMQAMIAELEFGGAHGEQAVANFRAAAAGVADVRGKIGFVAETRVNTVGPPVDLGPVAEGKQLHATLHVSGGSGLLGVKIDSAADADMTVPTDRIVFPRVADGDAHASSWMSVDGPIADRYYRVTVNASEPRKVAVAFGIA